jgi:hypothetical protein
MLQQLLGQWWRRQSPEVRTSAPPDRVDQLWQQAQRLAAGGDNPGAIAVCRRILELDPLNYEARLLWSAARMPGEPYRQIIKRIHAAVRPKTYVEIGVNTGSTIVLAHAETLAIGIDPAPNIKHALPATTRIFTQTSDDFFAHYNLAAEFGGQPVDLAFIDGMHHFDFALRDFINIEASCTPESTILVHDCYPLDALTAGRERKCQFWSGDVWKLVISLKRHRPDLAIHTIGCAPTGLAMIRNLDPASGVLAARLDQICDEMMPMPFSAIEKSQAENLNLFPNDWGAIHKMLGIV